MNIHIGKKKISSHNKSFRKSSIVLQKSDGPWPLGPPFVGEPDLNFSVNENCFTHLVDNHKE